MSRRQPATAAQVREACATHRTLREAAASLGMLPTSLSRLRRQLGLVEQEREQQASRHRLVLELPAATAAHALGLSPRQVRRLRQHAKARLKDACKAEPQPTAEAQA